jgi:hypothetical protein
MSKVSDSKKNHCPQKNPIPEISQISPKTPKA